jgi:hypothetical protein
MITQEERESLQRAMENNKHVVMIPDTLPIHRQLKVKRVYCGFTLVELASILGMGVSTLSEVENAKRRIPYKYLERVKSFLYNEEYEDKEFLGYVEW